MPNGNTLSGTRIQLWGCNNTAAQNFKYDKNTKEMKHIPSGKCVDILNANSANGTPIQLWDCNGSNAQKWDRMAGSFKALDRCLDVPGAQFNDGALLQLWDCNNSAAQNFYLNDELSSCEGSDATYNVLYGDRDTLWRGEQIDQCGALRSTNGNFRLVMQSDGNAVVYENSRPIWASNTNNRGTGPYRLILQDDSNFVLYDSKNNALWDSKTWNNDSRRLVMQNDGNLVLYGPNDNAKWASKW